MTIVITRRTELLSTAPQISVDDIEEIVAQGFKTIINNRPDGEGGPSQPANAEIEAAARQHGLQYAYLPVISGQITEAQTAQFAALIASSQAPVLAFCRSGARSNNLFQMASALPVAAAAERTASLAKAGKNPWKDQHDIVIVGGGSAGIGLAASLLRRQADLQIAIIEPKDKHYYQPAWTLVGAGEFNAKNTERNMADVIPRGVTWIRASVTGFSPEKNQVQIDCGNPITYTNLIVAPGLQLNWDAIPGLQEALGKNGVTSNYRFDLAPYTWSLVQAMKSGKAIFTQPPMPIKCAGAPQKAMYLSCSEWEKQGVLKNIKVEFDNAGGVLFGVPTFVPPLMEYVKRYAIDLQFNAKLISVNGPAKTARFEVKDAEGTVQQIEKSFDMLHVVPPQSAPDFVKNSPLANAEGWVDVDQVTLQHTRHRNIFSLGDACSSPNAKTAAAVRKQIVVVAENLLALRAGRSLQTRYDGYGSCPLTVEKGRIVLAEFGFGGKLLPTFPLNPAIPRVSAWLLKKHLLPVVYWELMLKGREWLARPSEQ